MNRIPAHRRLLLRLRHGGLRWLWYALRNRIAPIHPRLLAQARSALRGQSGIEIGGPSRIFRASGAVPAYRWLSNLDNVNFAAETAWEHTLSDGGPFQFHPNKPLGRQWLRESTCLSGLADNSFDCVLSSHCLEHTANPLAALTEWNRITKQGGHLLIIIPDPSHTFDHRRPITRLDHLQADRALGVTEADDTHFTEVLELHDLALDPDAGNVEVFRKRVYSNARERCLHHHVFDEVLLNNMLHTCNWTPLAIERFAPIHIGALAKKESP